MQGWTTFMHTYADSMEKGLKRRWLLVSQTWSGSTRFTMRDIDLNLQCDEYLVMPDLWAVMKGLKSAHPNVEAKTKSSLVRHCDPRLITNCKQLHLKTSPSLMSSLDWCHQWSLCLAPDFMWLVYFYVLGLLISQHTLWQSHSTHGFDGFLILFPWFTLVLSLTDFCLVFLCS